VCGGADGEGGEMCGGREGSGAGAAGGVDGGANGDGGGRGCGAGGAVGARGRSGGDRGGTSCKGEGNDGIGATRNGGSPDASMAACVSVSSARSCAEGGSGSALAMKPRTSDRAPITSHAQMTAMVHRERPGFRTRTRPSPSTSPTPSSSTSSSSSAVGTWLLRTRPIANGGSASCAPRHSTMFRVGCAAVA
jgi:hypothetical protein